MDQPGRRLRSYIDDHLKEEILAEGLVRNLPPFAAFLAAAALADAELVNYVTIARDCGVSAPTVRGYFEILTDTLLARLLPAYTRRPKRRVIQTPKCYFADVGVVNVLARRGRLVPGSELFGKAFESWVFHELSAYRAYRGFPFELAYWRLATGTEVDFVVDDLSCAIEAKATARVHADHLKGLRELHRDDPRVGRRIVVGLATCSRPRRSRETCGVGHCSKGSARHATTRVRPAWSALEWRAPCGPSTGPVALGPPRCPACSRARRSAGRLRKGGGYLPFSAPRNEPSTVTALVAPTTGVREPLNRPSTTVPSNASNVTWNGADVGPPVLNQYRFPPCSAYCPLQYVSTVTGYVCALRITGQPTPIVLVAPAFVPMMLKPLSFCVKLNSRPPHLTCFPSIVADTVRLLPAFFASDALGRLATTVASTTPAATFFHMRAIIVSSLSSPRSGTLVTSARYARPPVESTRVLRDSE